MRKLYLFIGCLLWLFCANAQNILRDTLKISGLEGSLEIKYDTMSASRGKLAFYYKKGNDSITSVDSAFTEEFSKREFMSSLDTIGAALSRKLQEKQMGDFNRVQTAVPIIINQEKEEWFKKVKERLKPQKAALLLFKPEIKLELSDSLTADIIPNCYLPIYKIEKKTNGCDTNIYYRSIPISRISIQINDGFIYAMNFDIDTTLISDSLKNIIQEHQSFSIRYNLRHNMLAKGMLYNTPALILKRKNTNYNSKVRDMASGFVFYIKDFINYLAPLNARNSIFTAKDTIATYTLCTGSSKDTLRIPEKSLYSILNLDVFGDLVGFFNEANPNGLIQSELKAHFYGFRKPLGQKNAFRSRLTLFNKGEVFFRFSKIDNKNRFLDVLKDSVPRLNLPDSLVRYVHGYRLLEYQNINAGLRINLFDLENRGGSVSLPVELSFLRSPLRDTLFIEQVKANNQIDTILSPVSFGKNTMMIVPGINFKFFAASFLDIDLRSRIFFMIPLTRQISMSAAEYDDFYGNNKYINIKTTKLLNLGAHVTVNLNTDKTRRLIIRGENYIDLKQRGNNFWQAQVGYSADLNKFINLSNGKK
jgi:hypothetical protein